MKTFAKFAVTLLVIAAASQARLALADDYLLTAGSGSATAGKEKATTQEQSSCNSCGQASCCDQSCDPGDCLGQIGCECGPSVAVIGFAGVDSFHGISEGALPGNFGVVTGFNAGAPIPGLGDYGIGWQVGLSYGIYDVDGRVAANDQSHAQTQTFVTTGLFRKARGDQRLSFGVVYDWMFNSEWGYLGNDPTLGQWRGQVEYAVSGCNGFGVWACQRDLGSVQTVRPYEVSDRAISQANIFWHHKFACSNADTWVFFGIPDHGRYNHDKSLADWTFGFSGQVPITERFALYGNASYLHPSAAAGVTATAEAGYDLGVGIAWYFGGNARSDSLNGKCWTPYLPVANNSTFLVEQGVTTNSTE